jgi:hypothetical protein
MSKAPSQFNLLQATALQAYWNASYNSDILQTIVYYVHNIEMMQRLNAELPWKCYGIYGGNPEFSAANEALHTLWLRGDSCMYAEDRADRNVRDMLVALHGDFEWYFDAWEYP